MAANNELEIMSVIDKHLSEVDDAATRERILRWAWEKFGSLDKKLQHAATEESIRERSKRSKPNEGGASAKSKVASLSIVKDLNLKPAGKQSFAAFAEDKKPESHYERCLVAVYYLRTVLEVESVAADHVFTCFKVAGWRVPADLKNTMQVAASTRGWLDTRSMVDIKVTVHGENYVEHDLPTESNKG